MTATTSDPIDGFLLNNGMAINPKIFDRAKKDLETMIALARLEGALEELENLVLLEPLFGKRVTDTIKGRLAELENQIKGLQQPAAGGK